MLWYQLIGPRPQHRSPGSQSNKFPFKFFHIKFIHFISIQNYFLCQITNLKEFLLKQAHRTTFIPVSLLTSYDIFKTQLGICYKDFFQITYFYCDFQITPMLEPACSCVCACVLALLLSYTLSPPSLQKLWGWSGEISNLLFNSTIFEPGILIPFSHLHIRDKNSKEWVSF